MSSLVTVQNPATQRGCQSPCAGCAAADNWPGCSVLHARDNLCNISVDTNGAVPDFFGAEGFAVVDAGIDRLQVFEGSVPEGIFDDPRGVHAHTQFEEEDLPGVCLQVGSVTVRRPVPALILHEGFVGPQVCRHRFPAARTFRDEFGGDPHIFLFVPHLPDNGFIVIGLWVAGDAALEQAVVALGVKQAVLVKAGFLKTVIHIGGEHKIILVFHQGQQILIDRFRRVHIAIDHDVSCPECPHLFRCFVGVKTAGIHISKAIFFAEVGEIFLEAFPAVGEPGGGGESRSGADEDCVRFGKCGFQSVDVIRAVWRRWHSLRP